MHAPEFDDDDGKPTSIVRRHREDKHLDALKNPLLVRRYDRRARGAWRRRRRDAKRQTEFHGRREEEEEEHSVTTLLSVPEESVEIIPCDWEVVEAETGGVVSPSWPRFLSWFRW